MKKRQKTIIIIMIVAIILIIVSIIFAMFNFGSDKIISRVQINGMDVGGLTQEEATKKIQEWIEQEKNNTIELRYQDFSDNISAAELNFSSDIQEKLLETCKIGKTGNILQDNYQILFTYLFGKNMDIQVQIDDEKLNKVVQEIEGKLPNAKVENSYYIEGNQLIIKKGKTGLVVNQEKLKEEIIQIIKSTGESVINIPCEQKMVESINIEKIHNEIYKEPENAYIEETDEMQVHPEVNGVDFAISIEEAEQLLQKEKDEYAIPLKITEPEVTLMELGKEAFPEQLAKFSTRYDASNKNRSNNLELSSEKIDGTIVLPGEVFSYNQIVGERTIAAGYKEAAVYENGKVVDGIGGGICQLSSTLYNAVLYANLEIVNRSNHRFLTSYVDAGRDATVSWGTIDFKFKNSRKYPIKVTSKVSNGIVTVEIYGIQEPDEYDVELKSEVLEEIPYQVNYIEDDTLEKGVEQIEQMGTNGAKSVTYKILKKDGIEVSREEISRDTYSALDRIIRKGTKEP